MEREPALNVTALLLASIIFVIVFLMLFILSFYSCAMKKGLFSCLVCADSRLNVRFSFTRDGYRGFLLRHNSFSYVIVCQKLNMTAKQLYPKQVNNGT